VRTALPLTTCPLPARSGVEQESSPPWNLSFDDAYDGGSGVDLDVVGMQSRCCHDSEE
jgi:hypothetical protein